MRLTGAAAGSNPFRFSTKRTEDGTGLVLYEYRPYSPALGRWLSRDPIAESMVGTLGVHGHQRGKSVILLARLVSSAIRELQYSTELLNEFHMCRNRPVDRFDILGLGNEWYSRGRCCNSSQGEEWALVSEGEGETAKCYWKKLEPGECIGGLFSDKDCEGMTCGGGFYVVKPYDLTGYCKTPGCDRWPYTHRRWTPEPDHGNPGAEGPRDRCRNIDPTPPGYKYGPRRQCCDKP
ncbi:RHS repeat-associated core domain-containing protein [Limisphaera ngatamarikiensis]|uniref:RHS repeat-associated core domain-containing protein n=1 Tax=Limisphaera ngatamarikiensis TaxID=1324935 RepID=UPI003CCD2751